MESGKEIVSFTSSKGSETWYLVEVVGSANGTWCLVGVRLGTWYLVAARSGKWKGNCQF